MMMTDDISNFNEDKAFKFNKVFNENNVGLLKLISSLSFSDILRLVEYKVTGDITYNKKIPGVIYENSIYKFKKAHKIQFKYNFERVEINDDKFGIIVSRALDDSETLIDDYCEYFAFKYNEYVVNPNNDRLSSGAKHLAKMMGDKLEYVRSKENTEGFSSKRF